MKLKNKKTGEIGELQITEKHCAVAVGNGTASCGIEIYSSLAELNEEWEDVPEPKEYWYISDFGYVFNHEINNKSVKSTIEEMKSIGNYFLSREEAEKAVEKLKALTKLCKKGFEFNSVEMFGGGLIRIEASIPINEKTTLQERSNITDSLYLLFGGEE
ncbi:MAG: hypothetical protein U0L97_03030 [Candidatus Saccharimonadaceae bacterium]|nr:hypothetical protein [Candidatus Saccharimonadaceae bacterium]